MSYTALNEWQQDCYKHQQIYLPLPLLVIIVCVITHANRAKCTTTCIRQRHTLHVSCNNAIVWPHHTNVFLFFFPLNWEPTWSREMGYIFCSELQYSQLWFEKIKPACIGHSIHIMSELKQEVVLQWELSWQQTLCKYSLELFFFPHGTRLKWSWAQSTCTSARVSLAHGKTMFLKRTQVNYHFI